MKFDLLQMIEMEQNPIGSPARIGDSFAETFRLINLESFLYPDSKLFDTVEMIYGQCRTPIGLLRHPKVPEKDEKGNSWREPDFSWDQFLPGFIALKRLGFEKEVHDILSCVNFKSIWPELYNGKLAPPTFKAALLRSVNEQSWFWDLSILFQLLAMKYLGFRWSDADKKFESSKDSSADWINWIHLMIQAENSSTWVTRFAKRFTSQQEVFHKVMSYYAPEPHSQWVLDKYLSVIRLVFNEQ